MYQKSVDSCVILANRILPVTIHPEGRQFHATDKICKKVQEIVYWCGL